MVDNGGIRAMLAKSRRMVLVSRNLARLLGRRIDIAEQLKSGAVGSIRARSGRAPTMKPSGAE